MATPKKEPWVPRKVSNAGLEVEYEQAADGTWSHVISKDGTVLREREGYANANSCACGVANWFHAHYLGRDARQARLASRPEPRPPALGPGTSQLHEMMNARADDNEGQAIRLREQADRLEMEAKRLRAAAEVLGEDYG